MKGCCDKKKKQETLLALEEIKRGTDLVKTGCVHSLKQLYDALFKKRSKTIKHHRKKKEH